MYKSKEIKNMIFDVFHKTGEYMDNWQFNLKELDNFLCDCEYMFGKKWEPIYLSQFYSDATLCHIVNILYKHGYIVCFKGELDREFNGTLNGKSTLLDYAQNSKYRDRQEKARLKKYYKKY